MKYEYKTVGAPEKGKRKRGLRTQSERVALAFEGILQAEAVDGWEYQRTDLLPVTERAGWFRRGHEVHRAVMVFRRPLEQAKPVESAAAPSRAPSVAPPPPPPIPVPVRAPAPESPVRAPAPEPTVSDDPDLRMADLVRGPDNPKPEG